MMSNVCRKTNEVFFEVTPKKAFIFVGEIL